MGSLYSRSAKYAEVILDKEAFKFHLECYLSGNRYPLSLACYQYYMSKK